MKYLAKNFESASDLDLKLFQMFRAFDIHRRGKLTFQDVALGVHRANPTSLKSRLTEDEFFEMTDNLKMCESDGTLHLNGFKSVILRKLRAYLQRRSAEAALFMQAPAEMEALLLNTKFLMVETHLMTEALIKEEARKQGASQHAPSPHPGVPHVHSSDVAMARTGSIEKRPFFSNSFKNGEIFSSERCLMESRDKHPPATPASSSNSLAPSPTGGTPQGQSLGGAQAEAQIEDFDVTCHQLDTGQRATGCTCSSAVRLCAPSPSRIRRRASFATQC